jgi:D-3-phosphoglycerate dehydrogenase
VTDTTTPVAVCSRSFSRNPVLREETLARFENVRFNDEGVSLNGESLVEFLSGRERAITALERINDEVLVQLPELKLISKVGVGTDMIDFDAAERHGVEVRVHPGTNSRSVAELALSMAIALLRRVPEATALAASGEWKQLQGRELSGKTVGIVGFGHVGRDLARLLEPFGCRVVAADVRPLDDVEQLELDELLAHADVVSLHVELNDATRNLIDARRLALMRENAVILNTARGGVIDEDALLEALESERLGGAGLDVLAAEPPGDLKLLEHPRALVTPHIGGSTQEAVLAMGRAAIAGLG